VSTLPFSRKHKEITKNKVDHWIAHEKLPEDFERLEIIPCVLSSAMEQTKIISEES
jgi:hypothetical protein